MTQQQKIDVCFAPAIDTLIDQYLTSVGMGFNPGEMRRYCRREALRLNAKTDAELSLIGLTREQIPAHVLRHRLTPLAA
ncbi:MAG: hypothetical protein NXH97_08655 [Rhodobacteraceae bacterium]|nr:hypothetical protein [Paracoccaceae bacterium]